MPEGDTIFRAAAALHRALAGHVVTRFESVYPAVSRVAEDRIIIGRTVESAFARGKHLLVAFSGDLALHTHMRMNGSWHLYRAGERWKRPARDMRVLVATATVEAVGFNVPVAELLTARDIARHRELGSLGPDLLDAAFDSAEAVRRMRARPADAVGDILLNQRVMAGIGNIWKSESLFRSGVDPFTRVRDLDDAAVAKIIANARKLLRASANGRVERRVYSRGGQPCRKCGTRIAHRAQGPDARLTYWCPKCQKTLRS